MHWPQENFYATPKFSKNLPISWEHRDGAVVRALASHQCGPGSNPGFDAICGLILLLFLSFVPWFFSTYSGFPLSSKTNNSKFDQESGRRRTTLWKCYLQIIIIIIIIIKFCHVVRLQFSTWVACCGFTLGFGGMFLKTWRVHKIFLNRTRKMVGW